MKSVTEKMRQLARELLEKKEVDLVIGWEKGTFFYDSTPAFITRPEDAGRLIWDEFCSVNLAKYLMEYRQKEGKTAIFVKGCDARGVNRLLQDLQLDRDKLYLIGIPCPGMKSARAAMEAGPGKNADLPLEEKCFYCTHPNPVIYDVLLGEEVTAAPQKDRFAGVEEIEKMDPEARYEFWSSHYDRCLRCYACRNVCPACNCRECIFDQGQNWLERSVDRSGNEFYGLVRAFHVAGRCIECGECERVCPAGIPIMKLNRKIAKDINELFGEYEAGLDLEVAPPLGLYKTEDPEEFM